MTRKPVFAIAGIAGIVILLNSTWSSDSEPGDREADTQAVYGEVIWAMVTGDIQLHSDIFGQQLAIIDHTLSREHGGAGQLSAVRRHCRWLSDSAIRDYSRMSAKSRPLGPILDLPAPYLLVTDNHLASASVSYDNLPRDVFALSAVGFSRRRDQALVYVVHSCAAGECGSCQFVLLDRRGGAWRVVDRVLTEIA